MNTIGRQLILVGIAVAFSAGILAVGFDPDVSGSDAPTPEATPQPEPTPGEAVPTAVPASGAGVTVLVANSTGTDGLAGGVAADLAASFGYTTLPPVDSTGEPADTTLVFYGPGSEPSAAQVATSLGLDPALISPMPGTPPVADLAGAQVLVLLGLDKVPAG